MMVRAEKAGKRRRKLKKLRKGEMVGFWANDKSNTQAKKKEEGR